MTVSADNVKRVAVIGAGTMGPGMAAVFAAQGYDTRLNEIKEDALERAKGTTELVYNTLVGAEVS